jgi:dihydrofolate reductase
MGRLIVVQFTTLDGVVEDPDGSNRAAFGGWAMRYGPQGVAGDKFRLGRILQQGTLLFGRRTWEHFSKLWPNRDDPFSRAMNAADKAVVTHREIDEGTWSNSHTIDQPLAAWVRHRLTATDVVVVGSHSVVDELAEADLVDEYRLLTFPTAVGAGRRLFKDTRMLELVSAEQVGPAVLSVLSTRGV